MARPDKAAAVAEIADELRESSGAVLTEYRGLTVAQITELRRSLGQNARFRIVKNTLTKIAVTEAGIDEQVKDLLEGPSAIAFIRGDVVEAAKGLRDFAKANSPLVIKGGVIDGKSMSAEDVTKLADLESREVLLSKLAGALKAKQGQAAAVFQALPSKTVRLAQALADKRSEEAA
ncbi:MULTISPECIES: 50S ribosomal protein L10 [unclassified Nocardiopsis]|uniref:50S ribosomal protein L10 n=1 Tax=unclassified Nocardiopsis TaxID=2649073 RepID=UPI001358789D|nr:MULTISPECIES: 50S ribosomal protein L10 [unclassified Nocardiopsis]